MNIEPNVGAAILLLILPWSCVGATIGTYGMIKLRDTHWICGDMLGALWMVIWSLATMCMVFYHMALFGYPLKEG